MILQAEVISGHFSFSLASNAINVSVIALIDSVGDSRPHL